MSTKTNPPATLSERRADGDPKRAVIADLRRLERVFGEEDWRDDRALQRARKRARARAEEVLAARSENRGDGRLALLVAAAELFAEMRAELVEAPRCYAALVQRALEVSELPAVALAREVMRAPELLNVMPSDAVDAQLTALTAFAPLRSASLWVLDDREQPICLRHVGEGSPSRAARELARRLLAGEGSVDPDGSRRVFVGTSIGRSRQPLAALVASARAGAREACEAYLSEAAPMLAAVLERDSLLAANAKSERALVASSERKLTRLGFDLHDGPIQEIAALGDDLRLFRGQLETVLASAPQRKIMHGRLEDLDAQLVALDSELRRISNEVHAASVLLNRPFSGALSDVVRAFETRTTVKPRVLLEGDMGLLSVSQQIALLNVLHEALTNIREHSDATRVGIVVSVSDHGVEAQVSDNGRGFDLEQTLVRAARRGRLGLVAMHERVRLLGGQCRIDSRPGGPTTINVALERWEPLVDAAAAAPRTAQPSLRARD
jgi:signal transduction histidine kinase